MTPPIENILEKTLEKKLAEWLSGFIFAVKTFGWKMGRESTSNLLFSLKANK